MGGSWTDEDNELSVGLWSLKSHGMPGFESGDVWYVIGMHRLEVRNGSWLDLPATRDHPDGDISMD